MKLKFYGSKLNINANIFNQNIEEIKKELIPKRINSFNESSKDENITIGDSKTKWTIANVKCLDKDLISADIVKVFKSSIEQLSGSKTISKEIEEANKVHFYYYVNDEILLMQSSKEINHELATSIFKKIISQDVNIGEVILEPITKSSKFKDELLNSFIRKLSIEYITPNDPRTLDSFADILSDNNANKGKLELENQKNGIKKFENNKPSKIIKEAIELNSLGYGQIIALIGKKKKDHKILRSESYPASSTIDKKEKNNKQHINFMKDDILNQKEVK